MPMCLIVGSSLADTILRAGHENELVGTLAINSLMSKPRLMRKMKETRKTKGIRRILS